MMLTVLLAAALAVSPAAAEPAATEGPAARTEPQQPQLGQPFTYEASFTHDARQTYELLPPELPPVLELLDVALERQELGEMASTTVKLRLAAFALDDVVVPALTLRPAVAGEGRAVSLPAAPVKVARVLGPQEARELQDIASPLSLQVLNPWAVAAAVMLGCAVLAGAFAAVRWWQRRRRHLPLDVRTHQALRELAAEQLAARGRSRELHFRLSALLRGYLAERYSFDARECTSAELLRKLSAVSPPLTEGELKERLHQSDLARFASARMSAEQCDEAIAFVHRVVEITTPVDPRGAHAGHHPA